MLMSYILLETVISTIKKLRDEIRKFIKVIFNMQNVELKSLLIIGKKNFTLKAKLKKMRTMPKKSGEL